jgi:membrane protein DedA with SNARE-associated domain
MTELNKKFFMAFIPASGFLIWALLTMIKSFGTGETWRIALSTAGFLLFLGLVFLGTIRWIKIFKKEQNNNNVC